MQKTTRPERRRLARQSRKLEKKAARPDRFPRPKFLADIIMEKYGVLAVPIKEAAIYLGVSLKTIYNLVDKGSLLRVGRGLIDGPTLMAYKKATGGRLRCLGSQWGPK